VLTQGTAPLIGVYDSDALHAYFGANSPVGSDRRRSHRQGQLSLTPVGLSERPLSA